MRSERRSTTPQTPHGNANSGQSPRFSGECLSKQNPAQEQRIAPQGSAHGRSPVSSTAVARDELSAVAPRHSHHTPRGRKRPPVDPPKGYELTAAGPLLYIGSHQPKEGQ